MIKYRNAGQSLLQSDDPPFVNQYGAAVARPPAKVAPEGASDGDVTPGGGGSPILFLSSYSLSFSAKTGGSNPPEQTVAIVNDGDGTLAFTVGSMPSWMTISPVSGGAPATLTVNVRTAGLAAGTYSANVTITASGAVGSPATLAVSFVVEAEWDVPLVDPINKKAWLGYFKTATTNGEYTTTACTGTANACVVGYGDFGTNPATVNWQLRQRNAGTQIAALGGKIFIGAKEEEILNMKGQWDQVGGIFTALEAFSGTVAEKIAALEQQIRDMKTIMVREGLSQRIFTTYIDSSQIPTLTKWPSGMNWLMLGVYLPYNGVEGESAVQARGAAVISTCMTSIKPLIPSGGKVVLAAQAFDRYSGDLSTTWDAVTLEQLQKVYPDALRTYPEIHGIFWFCYERSGHGVDGYPTLIPWHKATKQAILGVPDVEVPASGPTGTLLVCNTTTISGTAYDANYPNQSVFVQIYDGPGVLGQNSNRVGQLVTNAADTTFSMSTPASLLDGAAHTVHVYVVSKSSPVYQVPLIGSPQVVKLEGGSTGVTTSGRSFLYKAAAYTWKGATAFMAVKRMIDGGASAMDTRLDYWQGKGVNNLRVFGMISDSGYWKPYAFNPSTAGYYDAWKNLLTAAAARNIVIEACFFADAQLIPPYNTQTGRLSAITTFITELASYKNFTVEICNEPYKNGITSTTDLVALANAVRAVDPTRVITFGASTPASDTSYDVSPTSYIAIHSDRTIGWKWVTDVFSPSNPNVSQSTKPCVDNEPINATSSESSQKDPDAARWYAYGLGCQLRQLSSTFHYGDGKFATLPDSTTENLLISWLNGRNDVSWSWGGTYFHGSYPTTATSPFNNSGVEQLIMGRVLGGNAVALVVAPPSYTPSLRPGWTATQIRKVTDSTNTYSAYYFTLSYS